MSVSPFDGDPFGRCLCPPSRLPGATDPRLVAATSYVPTRPGVIHLSASLWGGEWRRTVPLSLGQAHALGAELLGLVQLAIREGRGAGSLPLDVIGGDLGDVELPGQAAARGRRQPSAAARGSYPRPRMRPVRGVDSAA